MFIDDLEQYTRWMNDIEVTRYLGQVAKCYSLEREKEILERMIKEDHNFAIVLKKEDRYLVMHLYLILITCINERRSDYS